MIVPKIQSFDQRSCQPNSNHSTNGRVNLRAIIRPNTTVGRMIFHRLTRPLVEWLLLGWHDRWSNDCYLVDMTVGRMIVLRLTWPLVKCLFMDQRSCQPSNNHSTNGRVNLWKIIRPTVVSTKNNHSTNDRINLRTHIGPTVMLTRPLVELLLLGWHDCWSNDCY
jgi:hypothetical protein